MERYGQILTYTIPAFVILIIIEKLYGIYKGNDTTPMMDTMSSLYSGVTNAVKDVLGLSISIISYEWLLQHFAVTQIATSVWMYLIVFIILDFQGYWVHRWSHKINFFWNKHAIHHSSEEFNLACALRQSISSWVSLFTFFLIPAAILGVPVLVVATIAPIHLFAQFWYHTQHIERMGFLEKIIVTPAHHRVHHAINPEYMDKNYAPIFILWDHWFGTFQEEIKSVPPVYGISVPANTWNPIKINFQHLWILTRDAIYTRDWRDKLRLWWMPTGWRPADMKVQFPLQKIENVYDYQKFNPTKSKILLRWSLLQLLVLLSFLLGFFGNIAIIGFIGSVYIAFFIFVSIYSFTELMDGSRWALGWEVLRCFLGLSFVYSQSDCFGIERFIPNVTIWMGGYFIVSLLGCVFVSSKENIRFLKPFLSN
jgi:alkylglycerol monooxygenase